MENAPVEFAKNYLRLRGYDVSKMFWECTSEVANNNVVKINSQNEFLVLFDVDNAIDDFTITSDEHIPITKSNFIFNDIPYMFQIVTGNVVIDATGSASALRFGFFKFYPEVYIKEPKLHIEINQKFQ